MVGINRWKRYGFGVLSCIMANDLVPTTASEQRSHETHGSALEWLLNNGQGDEWCNRLLPWGCLLTLIAHLAEFCCILEYVRLVEPP